MITLSASGILTVLSGVTLLVLLLVILQKEPDELADTIDRTLLVLAFGCFAASMIYSGVLVMAGALAGVATTGLTNAIIINNGLKIIYLVLAWIKIIRNTIHNRRQWHGK